jgi:hypothetical protein
MKKLNEKLSEVFDIEPIDIQQNEYSVSNEVVEEKKTDDVIEDDAQFARDNIRNLIKKGSTAMDELLTVAKASEHPRAYEVAAGLIKNLADLNKDLLDIQKKKKDLNAKEKSSNNNGVNVDKAVFIGSTGDLIKLLKSENQK